MKRILLMWICIIGCGYVQAQDMEAVMREVEANNLSLRSMRELNQARYLEDRIANNLEDPEAEYIHTWGRPSSLGTSGEFTVTQSFDFPSAYVHRARIARIRNEQYGYEYSSLRQQTLYEAQSLCYDIIALRRTMRTYGKALQDARRSLEIILKREAAGDAGALDLSMAQYELLTSLNNVDRTRIELDQAIASLRRLNGGVEPTFGDEDFPVELPAIPDLAELETLYRTQYPDLLAAAAQRDVAEREVSLGRALTLPKLSVGYRHDFAAGEKFNGLVAGVSVPIFSGRNTVKVARARVRYEQTELERAGIEVRSSLEQLHSRARLLLEMRYGYDALMAELHTEDRLLTALEQGYITVSDYFTRLAPVYDAEIAVTATIAEYFKTMAMINMVNL